jgi:hypothetical protein
MTDTNSSESGVGSVVGSAALGGLGLAGVQAIAIVAAIVCLAVFLFSSRSDDCGSTTFAWVGFVMVLVAIAPYAYGIIKFGPTAYFAIQSMANTAAENIKKNADDLAKLPQKAWDASKTAVYNAQVATRANAIKLLAGSNKEVMVRSGAEFNRLTNATKDLGKSNAGLAELLVAATNRGDNDEMSRITDKIALNNKTIASITNVTDAATDQPGSDDAENEPRQTYY